MNTYSDGFKQNMVRKLLIPGAKSAAALSRDSGVPQVTLSRWAREHASLIGGAIVMPDKSPDHWSGIEKLKTVFDYLELPEKKRGKYIRERGIYSSHIEKWKTEFLKANQPGRPCNRKKSHEAKKIRELEKELHRKEKALAEVSALLVLKKKWDMLWEEHEEK